MTEKRRKIIDIEIVWKTVLFYAHFSSFSPCVSLCVYILTHLPICLWQCIIKKRKYVDWRVDSVVKITCSGRRTEFNSQHPHWVTQNWLFLWLQWIWCPSVASTGTQYIHTYRQTLIKHNIKIKKNKRRILLEIKKKDRLRTEHSPGNFWVSIAYVLCVSVGHILRSLVIYCESRITQGIA